MNHSPQSDFLFYAKSKKILIFTKACIVYL